MTMAAEPAVKHEAKKRVEKTVAKRAERRPAQSSTLVANSKSNAERKSGSTSRSVTLGKSHLSSYQGSGGRRDTNVRLKAPNIKPPSFLTGGGGKTGTLIVEWLIGVILIVWGAFDGTKKKGGFQAIAHDFFWRFFGWCFIFFVLALLMRGKNTGRVAVMFGGLLDLVLVITVANTGSFTALTNMLKNSPTVELPGESSSPTSSIDGIGVSGGSGTGNGSLEQQIKNLLLKPGAGFEDFGHDAKKVFNFFKHLF